MKIYAIADLHLSFSENVDKPMNVFGDGWDDYEKRLEIAWCNMLTNDDVMVIPGDLSWGLKLDEAICDLEWIHHMPGRKVLIKGNHDLWWSGITKLNSLYDDIYFLQNKCFHIPESDVAICGTRGWQLPLYMTEYTEHDKKIYDRELIRLELSLKDGIRSGAETIIAALHYPPSDADMRYSDVTKLLEHYGVKKCIYGHLHGMSAFGRGIKGKHNEIEYSLVSLDYLGAVPKLIFDGDHK